MEYQNKRWKHIEGLFGKISKEDHPIFSSSIQNLSFSSGDVIVQEGEVTSSLYLVLEGELQTLLLVDGQNVALSKLVAGSFFGEVSLLDPGPASATVKAVDSGELLIFSHASLIKMQKNHPRLFSSIVKRLSLHLAESLRRSGRGRLQQNSDSWEIDSNKEQSQSIFSWFGRIIFGK